jgi:hypothetical protein
MKYILQARQGSAPEWLDLLITEDAAEMEEELKNKTKIIPLNSLRIVKEVEIVTSFHVTILE